MMRYHTFGDRLSYLSLNDQMYNSPRDISQHLYTSNAWRRCASEIRMRDLGYDLGTNGVGIDTIIIVHHINPLIADDILEWNVDKIFNPNNLISCSVPTHNIIHYGRKIETEIIERRTGDLGLGMVKEWQSK